MVFLSPLYEDNSTWVPCALGSEKSGASGHPGLEGEGGVGCITTGSVGAIVIEESVLWVVSGCSSVMVLGLTGSDVAVLAGSIEVFSCF